MSISLMVFWCIYHWLEDTPIPVSYMSNSYIMCIIKMSRGRGNKGQDYLNAQVIVSALSKTRPLLPYPNEFLEHLTHY